MSVALPQITEVKRCLTGPTLTFPCQVIAHRPGALVVLYVLPHERRVHHLQLAAGTVTFGYFWSDRGYNVYHWMDATGRTLAHYVNLSDDTVIEPEVLSFRDLVVDLLLVPGAAIEVLDEEELPADLAPDTRQLIDRVRAEVTAGAPRLVADIEQASSGHWPAVFGQPRA